MGPHVCLILNLPDCGNPRYSNGKNSNFLYSNLYCIQKQDVYDEIWMVDSCKSFTFISKSQIISVQYSYVFVNIISVEVKKFDQKYNKISNLCKLYNLYI